MIKRIIEEDEGRKEMIYYSNELYHHGIKGQRWGIRRFQNSDGSLTSAGKSRYARGRDISRERGRIEIDEYTRLTSTSKAYQKAKREANRLVEKYGLDADDGGGGNSERWGDETLRRAGDRYWSQVEDISALDDQFYEKARKYADSKILEKYGDVGISDMKHYNNVNTVASVAATLAVIGGLSILSKK